MRRVTVAPAFVFSTASAGTSCTGSSQTSFANLNPLSYALKVAQEYAYDLVGSRLGVRIRPHALRAHASPSPTRKPPVQPRPALLSARAASGQQPRVYYACVARDGFLVESGALFKSSPDASLNCPYEVFVLEFSHITVLCTFPQYYSLQSCVLSYY